MLIQCFIIVSTLFSPAVGKIEGGSIPLDLQALYDPYEREPGIKDVPAEWLSDFLDSFYAWESSSKRWARPNTTTEVEMWLDTVRPKSSDLATGKGRKKRHIHFERRKRAELRMLSEKQRKAFFRACNMLREDTSVFPNKYEALIQLHTGARSLAARGGPAFFPFNRIFVYMFENALRQKDPTVTLPYWEFTRDAELPDPSDSQIWDDMFLGTGSGIVRNGPFANWRLTTGPLVRNVGGSPLMRYKDYEVILQQNSLQQISYPAAKLSNFEFLFSSLFRHIGGNMGTLETAPTDPLYFLGHAYADYVFEKLRKRQRSMGIDPQLDYPINYGAPYHGPNELMGLADFRNIDGLHDFFSELIDYEDVPTCNSYNQDCGTTYFRCDLVKTFCLPLDMNSMDTCSVRGLHRPTQNLFLLNGRGDINEWAVFPVKIFNFRSPELVDYGSYPISNGMAEFTNDVFSPFGYAETRDFGRDATNSARGWTSSRTGSCCSGATEIFVQSNGLNYNGLYRDAAVVEQKFTFSSTITYVAVKHPRVGQSVAILRAFDSNGRICAPACKVPGTNGKYEACNGVVTVSSGTPLMFGNNFGEAVISSWDFGANRHFPTFNESGIFMAFYCDKSDAWAFEADGRRYMHAQQESHGGVGGVVGGIIHPHHHDHGFGDIHRLVPKGLNKCEMDSVCLMNMGCPQVRERCRNGDIRRCEGGCGPYVACEFGKWNLGTCRGAKFFNPITNRCTPGNCIATENGIAPSIDPLLSAVGILSPNLVSRVSSMQQSGTLGNVNSMSSLWASLRNNIGSRVNRITNSGSLTGTGLLSGTGTLGSFGSRLGLGQSLQQQSSGRLGSSLGLGSSLQQHSSGRLGSSLGLGSSLQQQSSGRLPFRIRQSGLPLSGTRHGNALSVGTLQVSTGVGGDHVHGELHSSLQGGEDRREGRRGRRGRRRNLRRQNNGIAQSWLESLLS